VEVVLPAAIIAGIATAVIAAVYIGVTATPGDIPVELQEAREKGQLAMPSNATMAEGASGSMSTSKSRTAGEIIGQEKKGAINREFPEEWREATEEEIEKAAKRGDKSAQKAKKLLKDKRFDKKDNRK